MKLCKVLTGIGFLFLCLAVPAVAAQPEAAVAPAAQADNVSPLPADCGRGAVLPERSRQTDICPAAQPAAVLGTPDFLFESKKLGYCHCGCSSTPTCRTSADCGGASCDTVISCC